MDLSMYKLNLESHQIDAFLSRSSCNVLIRTKTLNHLVQMRMNYSSCFFTMSCMYVHLRGINLSRKKSFYEFTCRHRVIAWWPLKPSQRSFVTLITSNAFEVFSAKAAVVVQRNFCTWVQIAACVVVMTCELRSIKIAPTGIFLQFHFVKHTLWDIVSW